MSLIPEFSTFNLQVSFQLRAQASHLTLTLKKAVENQRQLSQLVGWTKI